ncbi:MAG: hypothetical protein NUV67_02585 [archaeon]|nr:hypothetical protein [archaeon]
MRELIRRPRIILLAFLVILSLAAITFSGLEMGIDFKGGTLFQIQLDESVAPDKMETVTSIVSERLDAFGLKDTKVNSLGDDFIIAQIAETDPKRIEQLETLLRTQGKFEATLDGETLFEGSDILQVYKSGTQGYGIVEAPGGFNWQLPFLLNQRAAENFSHKVFHRCTAIGFDVQTGSSYDCEATYFFIDRPSDSVLILPAEVYSDDSALLEIGNTLESIPIGTKIDKLLLNAKVPHFIAGAEGLSESQRQELSGLAGEKKSAIIHPNTPSSAVEAARAFGFEIITVPQSPGIPWVWTATGARQVISITPGIANLDPYVENVANATIFSQLVITGSGSNKEEATQELKALEVLLETGSLPIGIKSISKETISPLLGNEFLNTAILIGLVSLLMVGIVIFIRYRMPGLVIPIMLIGVSEIILILGLSSFIRFNLDLASVAGILAAVGTGVDDQIIITDELLRGENVSGGTFVNRIKRAFFIIFAAAATTIATMLPIIIFSFGLGKLRGFAIMVVVGVLIGIFITRPAYSLIAEHVLKKDAK